MNQQQFNEALCFIDADLVESYIKQKDALTAAAARKAMWLRVSAVAACLCIMVSAVFALPMLLRDDTPPVAVEDTTSSDTSSDTPTGTTAPIVITDPNTPPKAPISVDHGVISGSDSVMIGDDYIPTANDPWVDYSAWYSMSYSPRFIAHIVVEVKVIEVLPDIYYMPDDKTPRRVVLLEILDEIHGEGFPKQIYYTYTGYDETIFDGYDTFIFSLSQIGIENYVLINKTQGKVEFFPQMFEGCSSGANPAYGSVIAFSDGVLDVNFWKTLTSDVLRQQLSNDRIDYYINCENVELNSATNNYYPARLGDTVQKVKQNIIDTIEYHKAAESTRSTPNFEFNRNNPDYVSAEQIFTSEARKQLLEYVSPSENNIFYYDLNVGFGRYLTMTFYRLIHGYQTHEEIYMSKSEVVYKNEVNSNNAYDSYTAEQLQSVPDINYVINNLDLSSLVPPHITLDEKAEFRCCKVKGWYRSVNGKVYGIVRILWLYKYDGGTDATMCLKDDMYYLYDSDGNASIVEHDELKALLGDDRNIVAFDYEPQTNVYFSYK